MSQLGDTENVGRAERCETPEGGPQQDSGVFDVVRLAGESQPTGVSPRERRVPLRLDDIPAPLLGLNEFEQVVAMNLEARELLRVSADGWKGQPIQALLNFSCSIREEFRGNSSHIHTHRLTLPCGRDTPQSVTLTIRRTVGEGSIHYLCMISAGESPLGAGPGSSDQLAAMGQMIAGFAHEVRNPLAALKSIVEDLSTEPEVCATWAKDFVRLNALVGRIERLTRGSLRMVQSERPNRKAVAVNALLASALDLLGSRLRVSPDGSLKVTYDVENPTVIVDESQIVQVLVILLENALDAAGSAEHVRIRVRAEATPHEDVEGGARDSGRVVIVEIQDDGPGMSADIISKIFNPFFTKKPRGTGLGLSLALKLLRDNQGSVRVHSSVGKGSVFSIEVPGTP